MKLPHIPGHPGILPEPQGLFVTRTILPPPAQTAAWGQPFMPVSVRPGPLVRFTAPEPEPVKPLPSPELYAKFRYWGAKTKRLYKEGYLDRLVYENAEFGLKCYDGATGEDRRFAQWRLAFSEAARLMEKMEMV